MRQLVVISGKGGTGKTSITASLAALASPVVLADCDVDVPDLHLLAAPEIQSRQVFRGGRKARIVAGDCLACGRCARTCRFNAIHKTDPNGPARVTYAVDQIACEGCGACVAACPARAIRLEPVVNGEWCRSATRFGPMIHARLRPGEENSGKLVSTVRGEARRIAADRGLPLVLVDGSPGVGCPVIASLTGADLALVVAEPTPSGRHDALRVIDLARRMEVPVALCINRWDLNPALALELENEAAAIGASTAGRVREDRGFVDAQMQGRSLIEDGPSPAVEDLHTVWRRVGARLGLSEPTPATAGPEA